MDRVKYRILWILKDEVNFVDLFSVGRELVVLVG